MPVAVVAASPALPLPAAPRVLHQTLATYAIAASPALPLPAAPRVLHQMLGFLRSPFDLCSESGEKKLIYFLSYLAGTRDGLVKNKLAVFQNYVWVVVDQDHLASACREVDLHCIVPVHTSFTG